MAKRLLDTSAWQQARERHKRNNPLCVPCMAAGRVVAADLVHHTVPHHNDPAIFWREEWWESRCTRCHGDAVGPERTGSREVYAGCSLDGTPLDSRHHWNRR